MELTCEIDIAGLARVHGAVQRELPRDIVNALNQTAFAAMNRTRALIGEVFQAPTSFTQRAPRVRKASLREPFAEVYLAELVRPIRVRHYLDPHITGGPRAQKRMEFRLGDSTTYFVTARSAPLDASGNLKKGVLNKILAQAKAFADTAQHETARSRTRRRRRRQRGGEYFLVRRVDDSHLTPGVWERITTGFGSAVRPVLVETRGVPVYERRFPFDETVAKIHADQFPRELVRQFRKSIEKARQRAAAGGEVIR